MPFDREKYRSIGALSRGRTRDLVTEGRDESGYRTRAVTDQLGNTVTEHNSPDDRVDVNIQAPAITVRGKTQEIRVGSHG